LFVLLSPLLWFVVVDYAIVKNKKTRLEGLFLFFSFVISFVFALYTAGGID